MRQETSTARLREHLLAALDEDIFQLQAERANVAGGSQTDEQLRARLLEVVHTGDSERKARSMAVRMAIAEGADVEACVVGGIINGNGGGTTPLCNAMSLLEGSAWLVLLLAKAGADVNNDRNLEEEPYVLVAAERGQVEVVRALVEAGADVNKADTNGVTPLFVAVDAEGCGLW